MHRGLLAHLRLQCFVLDLPVAGRYSSGEMEMAKYFQRPASSRIPCCWEQPGKDFFTGSGRHQAKWNVEREKTKHERGGGGATCLFALAASKKLKSVCVVFSVFDNKNPNMILVVDQPCMPRPRSLKIIFHLVSSRSSGQHGDFAKKKDNQPENPASSHPFLTHFGRVPWFHRAKNWSNQWWSQWKRREPSPPDRPRRLAPCFFGDGENFWAPKNGPLFFRWQFSVQDNVISRIFTKTHQNPIKAIRFWNQSKQNSQRKKHCSPMTFFSCRTLTYPSHSPSNPSNSWTQLGHVGLNTPVFVLHSRISLKTTAGLPLFVNVVASQKRSKIKDFSKSWLLVKSKPIFLKVFFFWTMLRSSLQQWQSWSYAKIVIVGQPNPKERSGTDNTKQTTTNTPKQHQTKATIRSLTNRWKCETRWNRLTLSLHQKSPALTTSSASCSQWCQCPGTLLQ